jgi:hypothetical protein
MGATCFGQTPIYFDPTYEFSVKPPPNSSLQKDDSSGYVAVYISDVVTGGLFCVTEVTPFPSPKSTNKEISVLFQKKSVRDNNAEKFLSNWPTSQNVKIISNSYVTYKNRPSCRIDYSANLKGIPFTGAMVAMFIVEKQIIIGFNFVAPTTLSDTWNALSQQAIESFAFTPIPAPPPPRKNRAR